jgi:hypothetical protein
MHKVSRRSLCPGLPELRGQIGLICEVFIRLSGPGLRLLIRVSLLPATGGLGPTGRRIGWRRGFDGAFVRHFVLLEIKGQHLMCQIARDTRRS